MRKQIRKWFCYLFLSFLLVVLSSTSIHSEQVPNRQSSAGLVAANDSTKSDRILKPGDELEKVLKLQQQLRALGFYLGPTTGYYGETTTEAVRAFQQKQQLPQTGVADTRTLNTLNDASYTRKNTLELGDMGDRVAKVQRGLGIKETGVYDSATEEAVKSFQVSRRLPVTGRFGRADAAVLGLPFQRPRVGSGIPVKEEPEITKEDLIWDIGDETMQLKRGRQFEFRLKGKAIAAYAPQIKALSGVNNIRVKLNAPNKAFSVVPIGEEDQAFIYKDGEVDPEQPDVVWRWNVEPDISGQHDLFADINIVHKNGVKRLDIPQQNLKRTIQVKMSATQTIDSFVPKMDWLQKTVAAFTASIVAIATVLSPPFKSLWAFFRSQKSKSSNPSPTSDKDEPPSSKP